MRITGGELRGRPLIAPKGMAVRPTTDKVREALFSILGDVRELAVLDVCAGAGTLGLEALSRGATQATFIERSSPALAALTHNVESLGLKGRCAVRRGEAPGALTSLRGEAFHLIFADPPYGSGVLVPSLEAVAALGLLRPGGILVAEHDRDEALAPAYGDLLLDEERTYGRTVLSFYGREG